MRWLYIINIKRDVSLDVDTNFLIGFFQAIACGACIEKAYKLGLIHVAARNKDEVDNEPLILINRNRIPVSEIAHNRF